MRHSLTNAYAFRSKFSSQTLSQIKDVLYLDDVILTGEELPEAL
jgi:predicted amidophosphoribosyltransferase